ncbi:hypothetical protein OQH61_03545 [Helicobacter sp. MIT 21-1697]|uniref:hypothetical protein n=1 Tax=Helicobacter sp. MIT 21-1697 TaxID=2993733 RepID=UPI00224AEEA6|nr:hypothetical protein [Helicobacter sp. MIT 21-1697]MCX2716808.1 hypothetical protein [Helicobacter sp. MIT 21-1697]
MNPKYVTYKGEKFVRVDAKIERYKDKIKALVTSILGSNMNKIKTLKCDINKKNDDILIVGVEGVYNGNDMHDFFTKFMNEFKRKVSVFYLNVKTNDYHLRDDGKFQISFVVTNKK